VAADCCNGANYHRFFMMLVLERPNVSLATFRQKRSFSKQTRNVCSGRMSDLADVSLGATLLRANNLSLSVRYELQAGSGFVSRTGTVRVRQLF